MVVAKIDPKVWKPQIPTKPLPKPPIDIGGIGEKLSKAFDDKAHEQLDTNHDGNLNRDEFNAGEHGLLEKLTSGQKFDRYDKNNDGYVNKDEYHEGKKADRAKKSTMELPDLHDIGCKTPIGKVGDAAGKVAEKAADTVGNAIKDIF